MRVRSKRKRRVRRTGGVDHAALVAAIATGPGLFFNAYRAEMLWPTARRLADLLTARRLGRLERQAPDGLDRCLERSYLVAQRFGVVAVRRFGKRKPLAYQQQF